MKVKVWKSTQGGKGYKRQLSRHIALEIWICRDFDKDVDVWMTGIWWRRTLIHFPKRLPTAAKAIKYVVGQMQQLDADTVRPD